MKTLFAVIGLLWLGWLFGWIHAHVTVARECRVLGAFCVHGTVFRCVAVERSQGEARDE